MWQVVGWGLCRFGRDQGLIVDCQQEWGNSLGILMTLSQKALRKSREKAFLGEKPRPPPGTRRGVGPVWPVRGRGSSVLTWASRGGWAALAVRSQPLAWQVCHASVPQEKVGPAGIGWCGRDASAPEDFNSFPSPPSRALAGPSPGLAATLISQHAVHTLANRPKGQEASTG